MKTEKIASYLNSYMNIKDFKDYCPNGIQVEAATEVKKIVTGVSASLNLFKKAKAKKADMILVHHGLFWNGMNYAIKGINGERISFLIKNNITLMAYHLPLDAHPEIGNNALLAEYLGLTDLTGIASHGGNEIGIMGNFPKKISLNQLQNKFSNPVQQCFFGKKTLKKAAIVSGGAANDIYEAHARGADIFISGETKEPLQEWCREAKMNFIALGHYRSEKLGIKALGKHLAEKFSLQHEFVEIANEA